MFVTPAMCKGLEREYLTYRFNQHTNYLTGFFRSPLLEPGRTEFIFRPTKATITAYDRARLELNERSRLAQQKAGIPENLQQLAFSQSFSQDFNENDYRYSTVQATRWMEELTGHSYLASQCPAAGSCRHDFIGSCPAVLFWHRSNAS